MKRMVCMAALLTLPAGVAATQASAATATAAMDINSAYVWRGLTFNDGLVLQPSMDVAAESGFSFNVWGNFDVSDYDDTLDDYEFSEVDLTASYGFKLGAVDASLGVIEYLFPGGAASTTELTAGLSYEIGAGFSIATNLYYDVDQVDDYYLSANVAYSYDVNDKLNLGASGLISYAGKDFSEFYAGGTDSGFFNYTLSASASYQVTDAFGVAATINYSDSMDDDALPDEAVDTTFFGGVNLNYTF